MLPWLGHFPRIWWQTLRLKQLRRAGRWSDTRYYRAVFSLAADGNGKPPDKFASTRASITHQLSSTPRTARILDLGSGFGYQADHLRRSGCRQIYACDLVLDRVLRARELHGRDGVTYLSGNMLGLPFQDAAFDGVVIAVALHDLSWRDVVRSLAECRRVLQPGGTLVLMEPRNLSDLPSWLHRWIYRVCTVWADESPYLAEYLTGDLDGALRRAGFVVTRRQLAWGSVLRIYTCERPA